MTLRHLQIFLTVCEKRSMTEAANVLFMTQPSVSQVIKELETHYKVRLFERKGRTLTITRQGDILRSYAIHIVNCFEEVEKKLVEKNYHLTLRTGANVTVGVTMIQQIIKKFGALYPDVSVEVFINNSRTIREKIDRNELDFALVEEFPQMDAYITEPFFEDRNIVVAPVGHHLLQKEKVTAKDLTEENLLLREKGSGVRNLFDAVMNSRNLVVHPIWESYTSDALIEAVKAEIGIAVLPERIARPHINLGEMEELVVSDLDLRRRLIMFRHRSSILSTEGKGFWELVRNFSWNGDQIF